MVQGLLRPAGSSTAPAAAPGAAGLGLAGSLPPQVIADARTNKLFVQAYPHQFDEIGRMIDELDVSAPTRAPRYHIYKCKNVDADYLAGKLQQLLTGQGGTSRKGVATSTKPGQPATAAVPAPPTVSATVGAQGPQAKPDFNAVETRIVADELSNSLLIQADPQIFEQILILLEGGPKAPGLDRAPRRVLVEVQVLEVSTPTDNMTIGFELAGLQNTAQGQFRPEAATSFGLSTVGIDPTTGTITRTPNLGTGLTAVLTKDTFSKLPIVLTAVANLDKSRVITTPFALTDDNQPAHFDVTLTTSFQSQTLTTGFSTTTFTPLQIPSSIDVTPQVHSDDHLTLDVGISISTATGAPAVGAPPNVNARKLHAVVTVPNMHYVVFGGLESESFEETETKVPYVADVPVLGALFKTRTSSHSRSKIYVFVRATIFSDDRGLDRVSDDIREKARVLAEQDDWLPPIVSERLVRAPGSTIQDEALQVFGLGSGNPFATRPADE